MENEIAQLHEIMLKIKSYLFGLSEDQLRQKPAPGKWSKIEILGHLVDSGINNLQRFTEAQFMPEPYPFSNYQQDDLVAANRYQQAELSEVFGIYQAINKRIIEIMGAMTPETLAILLHNESDDQTAELGFIMTDYVAHMEHHLKQILR